MDLFSAKRIEEISSKEFDEKVKLVREKKEKNGEIVKVSEEYKGVELKKEIARIVKDKGRRLSPEEIEKELIKRGVVDSQCGLRKKIVETLKDHFDKDA